LHDSRLLQQVSCGSENNPKRVVDGLSKYYFRRKTARFTLPHIFGRYWLAASLQSWLAPPICVALNAIPHFTNLIKKTNAAGTTFEFLAPTFHKFRLQLILHVLVDGGLTPLRVRGGR